MVNAGKQGICLDLKSDAGRRLFLRLAAGSDVVVENYRDECLTGSVSTTPRASRSTRASFWPVDAASRGRVRQ
jgi:hypothetical protein